MSSKIEQAFEAWNKIAKTKIHNIDTFQNLISLSPKMRKWYSDWSFQYSAFSTMPKSFKDSGVTPEQWKEIEKKLPKINKVRAEASKEIEQKALEFSQFVEKKNRDVEEQLNEIEDEYIKILKVNVTCLPLEDQITILGTPKDNRSEVEQSLLESLRIKLLDDLKEGNFTDPFVYGNYEDLLI